ncbi:hypothetical protein BO99DRAFT_15598 [Aspergillus violaceofuscus CBS 115571]|uniref:Uncharacterized protein n=1 Tax=Aspergillus violaceofuscus (strain CBS 115571) TaxID=1450538 RepID=A0A2V5HF40_ASPV1|nr:hypothetical protein BO99DRAFT_15598 [Aspergillus violaceofuscus CBS 115571]
MQASKCFPTTKNQRTRKFKKDSRFTTNKQKKKDHTDKETWFLNEGQGGRKQKTRQRKRKRKKEELTLYNIRRGNGDEMERRKEKRGRGREGEGGREISFFTWIENEERSGQWGVSLWGRCGGDNIFRN